MLPGDTGQARDGIATDVRQAAGGANAIALRHVLENLEGFLFRQSRLPECRTLALGVGRATASATESSDPVLGFSAPAVPTEVFCAPYA